MQRDNYKNAPLYAMAEDAINDAELLASATERMAHLDKSELISNDELMREIGITDADLEGFESIELE